MCFPSFRRRSTSSQNDPHSYIHGVLERGDHGPHRHISFDLATLNDAIQQYAERIGICDCCNMEHLLTELFAALTIEADVKQAVAGNHSGEVTLQNHLGNVSFQCFVSTPHNLNELVQVMAKAKRENQSVKAIGSFYAFSLVNPLTL